MINNGQTSVFVSVGNDLHQDVSSFPSRRGIFQLLLFLTFEEQANANKKPLSSFSGTVSLKLSALSASTVEYVSGEFLNFQLRERVHVRESTSSCYGFLFLFCDSATFFHSFSLPF